MSVDMRVILLVDADIVGEYLHPYIELGTPRVYTCMYITVMDSSSKRWTFTLSKFDEPFGVWFHFERFLRTGVGWCEGRTLG
jgi:hypothetical protein